MKLLVVFSAAVALSGATQVAPPSKNADNQQGRVVSNELLRTTRRIFNGGGGGWGSGGGGGGGGDGGYRSGPPPGLDGGLLSLFNAMSSFGLNSNYGAPGGGGGNGRPPPPPPPQYGPPGSGGSGRPPSSQYGPPGSGGNGGRPPSSQYGPPQGGGGGPSGGYSGGQGLAGALPTRNRGLGGGGGALPVLRGSAPAQGPLGVLSSGGGLRSRAPALGGASGAGPDGGRIFRYVSLFTAPEEPAPTRPKIVRAGPSAPDKHVNIIFVRPPTPPAEQPTEVVLSPEPERKTIVYVLMKKPVEGQETVRVRPAPPTTPPKPEVYFIPYSDPNNPIGGGAGGQGQGLDDPRIRNAGGNDGGYSDGGNGVGGGQGGSGGGPSGYEDGSCSTCGGGGGGGPGGPSGGYEGGNSLGQAEGAIVIGAGLRGFD